jgi:tRNA(Arg) A34 adenosine deaminase TadA
VTAQATFEALDEPWQLAFAEAWRSWASGSAGVGAVINDTDGHVLCTGRNRMLEERREPGILASTALAHAEMNALAALRIGPSDDLSMTTTFEPCLMCASAIVQSRIPRVRYAAADPVFDGLHDWFAELPFAQKRLPAREELGGRMGAFAHVLHVSWLAYWVAEDTEVMEAHRRLRPEHLTVARDLVGDEQLAAVARDGGSVIDALSTLWRSLDALSL